MFSAGGVLLRTGRASHLTQARDAAPYPVDWVDGAIVMYAVAALDAISWVDPDYFLYFEDVDTAWRMRSVMSVNNIATWWFAGSPMRNAKTSKVR